MAGSLKSVEIRARRELPAVLAEYWRAVDDGHEPRLEAFDQFRLLVQVVFDEAHAARFGNHPAADAWQRTGWALLCDRSKAATAFSYTRKAGRNLAVSAIRREASVRKASQRAATDPTRPLGSPSPLDELEGGDALRPVFREVLKALQPTKRRSAVRYYEPGGPERLVDDELASCPTGTRGAGKGKRRTRAQAIVTVQKRLQRIRDEIGAEVFERTGIAPTLRAKPLGRSVEGEGED